MQEAPGLGKRYPREYTSWRNMKQRAKAEGVELSPEFETFAGFMEHMGSKPDDSHTLDRVVPGGPYTLANTRWASKRQQANNRQNTILIEYNGEFRPVTEVAELTGVAADTLRRRVTRGSRFRPNRRKLAGGELSVRTVAVDPVQVAARRLDPYRWVHREEEVIRFWASLYILGENDQFGTMPVVERVVAQNGADVRDETFIEFMVRMDKGIVNALTTGDLSDLPETVTNLLAGDKFDRQRQLETSLARLSTSHQAWLSTQFGDDPLVDDKALFSCSVPWLDEASAKENHGALARRAHDRFRKAKVPMPARLTQVLTDLSGLPLARRNIGI